MIKNKLVQLGLTENEASLYEYLLENHKAKASELAKHLKVTHPAVKKMVDSLLEKNLIKAQYFGKTVLYFLEEPNAILKYVKRVALEKEKIAKNNLDLADEVSQLVKGKLLIQKDADTSLRFYKGSDGLKEFVELASSAQENNISEFFDLDLAMYTKTQEKSKQKNLYKERGKKFDVIYTSKESEHESELLHSLAKIDKDNVLSPSADMLLFDDKVAFLFTTDKKNVLVIQNKWIYNTLKTFFINLQKHLKK